MHTVAANLVYRNTDARNRVQVLASTHGPGEAVLSVEGLPAVTVTGSGDYTKTEASFYAPLTISGIPAGGKGLEGKEVTLAFDGTWEFPEDEVANLSAATVVNGDVIYITTGLDLTDASGGGNVQFGYVDIPKDYDRSRGMIPIRIGD